MIYNPHDYQKYTTDFILSHPIAAVILQMGLGKTVCTLSAIESLIYDSFEVSKVLVIAPLRVAKVTWSDEINKWDNLSHLKYSIVVGSKQERLEALNKEADIYIINRENLEWLIDKSNTELNFDMVVIDELSSFKNYNSKRFKSFMKLRPKVKRVVGLTGTPSPNNLIDLFAEYKCLDMGERLGRFISQYRNNYFLPDKYNGQIVYSYALRPNADKAIYEKINDITISLKALDHLKMPELIINRYPVYMSDEEKNLYKELKKNYILSLSDDSEITAANAAALTNKLVQMSNGAIYGEDEKVIKIHDKKIDALEDIIEASTSPIMVCYWFKHDLERITARLDKLGVKYSRIMTEENIRDWNEGKYQVGLIHPASAGHGLNLQEGGNTIVWFGLTWSLELYQQTNARLYRQGQKKDMVVIEHIVTADTIDEDILNALTSKDLSQSKLIEAVKARIGESYDC